MKPLFHKRFWNLFYVTMFYCYGLSWGFLDVTSFFLFYHPVVIFDLCERSDNITKDDVSLLNNYMFDGLRVIFE